MKKLLVLACFVGFCFANADTDKLAKDLQNGCEGGKYDDCLKLAMLHDNNPFAPQLNDKSKAEEYYAKSLQVLQNACQNGDAKSCYGLGNNYLNGSFNTEKNGDKAHEYFKKGCFDLKNAETCYMTGNIYKALKDEVKAAEFTEKSCELKFPLCLYEKQYADQIKQKSK